MYQVWPRLVSVVSQVSVRIRTSVNPNDNDEERLSRIEHILEQLFRDSRTLDRVAANVRAVADATRSLSRTHQPAPPIADRSED